MRSKKTSSHNMRRSETCRATLKAIEVSSDLIAFYSQEIHLPQPYVILLDPVSGILKRVDLRAAK